MLQLQNERQNRNCKWHQRVFATKLPKVHTPEIFFSHFKMFPSSRPGQQIQGWGWDGEVQAKMFFYLMFFKWLVVEFACKKIKSVWESFSWCGIFMKARIFWSSNVKGKILGKLNLKDWHDRSKAAGRPQSSGEQEPFNSSVVPDKQWNLISLLSWTIFAAFFFFFFKSVWHFLCHYKLLLL